MRNQDQESGTCGRCGEEATARSGDGIVVHTATGQADSGKNGFHHARPASLFNVSVPCCEFHAEVEAIQCCSDCPDGPDDAAHPAEDAVKEWSDLAYELYALACNSTTNGTGKSEDWTACFERLRERFHAALDTFPPGTIRPCFPEAEEAQR